MQITKGREVQGTKNETKENNKSEDKPQVTDQSGSAEGTRGPENRHKNTRWNQTNQRRGKEKQKQK